MTNDNNFEKEIEKKMKLVHTMTQNVIVYGFYVLMIWLFECINR